MRIWLDSASRTTVLLKLYFDSLKVIHCDLGISGFIATCTQAVICQCSTLGCIIEGKSHVILFHYEFHFHVHCLDYLVHYFH